jgi:hypothetical protein
MSIRATGHDKYILLQYMNVVCVQKLYHMKYVSAVYLRFIEDPCYQLHKSVRMHMNET